MQTGGSETIIKTLVTCAGDSLKAENLPTCLFGFLDVCQTLQQNPHE